MFCETRHLLSAMVATTVVVDSLVAATLMVVETESGLYFEMGLALAFAAGLSTLVTAVLAQQARRNDRMLAELQRMVNRDRLTDVATRDHFFAVMEQRPMARGVSLMVDIDHFKAVNDTHGHFAGDTVIARVAQVLAENVRAQDMVCRFGGEEFVIFLDDCSDAEAQEIAERLRGAVEAARIRFDDLLLSVTVSIGAAKKRPLMDINHALQVADQALYRAKRAGRNRAILDMSPPMSAFPDALAS